MFRARPQAHRFVAPLILIAALLAAGCHGSAHSDNAASRTIRDDSGRSVTLPAQVTRIVSLAPNLTEILYAVGAGNTLVGDTMYCDYPEAAKHVEKVGDTLHPSIERILALKPQVVLVSTASQLEAFTRQLEEQQIAIFITDPHDLEGVFHSIQVLGDLTGNTDQAAALVSQLRGRVTKVESAVRSRPAVRVFYQTSGQPLYTAGRDSWITDLIKRAGGASVTADVPGAWPRFSDEAAIAARPDAIILPTGGSMGEANAEVAPALKGSPAVRSGRLLKINDDHLARPGPRLVDGLEEMAAALHPESFK